MKTATTQSDRMALIKEINERRNTMAKVKKKSSISLDLKEKKIS